MSDYVRSAHRRDSNSRAARARFLVASRSRATSLRSPLLALLSRVTSSASAPSLSSPVQQFDEVNVFSASCMFSQLQCISSGSSASASASASASSRSQDEQVRHSSRRLIVVHPSCRQRIFSFPRCWRSPSKYHKMYKM